MKVIVRDDGFHPDDMCEEDFISLEQLKLGVEAPVCLHLANDADPADLPMFFPWLRLIRIPFPDFTDGRGFSLAVRVRHLGYNGRLRADGHVIADQYLQARRSGFDEVAIAELQAARQPEVQWKVHVGWRDNSYQLHLLKSG